MWNEVAYRSNEKGKTELCCAKLGAETVDRLPLRKDGGRLFDCRKIHYLQQVIKLLGIGRNV